MEASFSDGTTLSISRMTIRTVSGYLERVGFERESGGVLLGFRELERPKYALVDMTLPGCFDSCGPFQFIRSKISANRAIRKAWNRSDGVVNYIGEWHTHAEPTPKPSLIDKRLMEMVVNDGSCMQDRAFMMIIGNDGNAFLGMAHPEIDGSFREELMIPWQV